MGTEAFPCIPLMKLRTSLMLCTASLLSFAHAGDGPWFRDLPESADPAAVGKQLIENFLPRKFRYETNPAKAHLGVIYPEVITWYGALDVASLTEDKELLGRLTGKFEPLLGEEGNKWVNRSAHVDYRVFGAVPLEIDRIDGDKRCRELGLELADAQWQTTNEQGITSEARYWIDDMYMIPLVQVQAYRATKDRKYIDRAARALCVYLDRLQEENGLFHHGENAPFFWGRGNGWMAAGAAEVLRDLPADHPDRDAVLKGTRRMMATLKELQTDDGLWRQLLDKPESWPETSGSAMFAFAMVSGVKDGWLDGEVYGPVARKAWLALTSMLDGDGNLREVCIGTDKGFSVEYYIERPRATGDLHGQAPMLWTAAALLR